MVEGARLESVFRGNSNVGSNPTLSASLLFLLSTYLRLYCTVPDLPQNWGSVY